MFIEIAADCKFSLNWTFLKVHQVKAGIARKRRGKAAILGRALTFAIGLFKPVGMVWGIGTRGVAMGTIVNALPCRVQNAP